MDPLAAIRDTFFQECEEQLAELEGGLLAIEGGDHDAELINAVFRAVHSIKGGAGAFGLEPLVRFSHVFETAMDEMRSGGLQPRNDVLKVMLRATDVLADHVRAARDGSSVDEARSVALAKELAGLTGAEHDESGAADEEIEGLDFQPLQIGGFNLDDMGGAALMALPELPDLSEPVGPVMTTWVLRIKPKRALYAHANETGLLLRELTRLGQTEITLDSTALPPLNEMDPDEGYFAWTVRLTTDQPQDLILEVFEFVDGHCDIDMRRADEIESAAETTHERLAEAAPPPLAPKMTSTPAETPDVADLIRSAQETLVEIAGDEARMAASNSAQAQANAPPPATIRVDLERVDRLIDLVGELVINQAVLTQRAAESGMARTTDISMVLDDLEQLTREIQDSVMAIRAQPVKSVFQRMPRLVREVAAAVGKQARLVTDGEGTEVDKTVIERLADPLTHMIRNAIDHGLETPEGRLAAGKPAEGLVRLSAQHRSGRIVIIVSDDGRGIDRKRVREIAVHKGLIDPAVQLSDDEIDNLIFLPGFSTAASISDISGRGVGMDVVKRSIQALGGRISISSNPGKGSTFTMSLPLTLAVLDGMVVSAAGQTLVAPLSAIIETLQPKIGEVKPIGPSVWLMQIRDSFVPLIDVGVALGFRDEPLDPTKGVALLVEGEGSARAALLVDAIQGQRQVVIKSLEANYRQVVGIAAATILGDGRVALILDVDAIVLRRRAEGSLEQLPALAAAG